jgi:hypothetical protein
MQPISTKYTEIDGTRYTWIVDYVADIHSLLPPNELLLASDESEWEEEKNRTRVPTYESCPTATVRTCSKLKAAALRARGCHDDVIKKHTGRWSISPVVELPNLFTSNSLPLKKRIHRHERL